MGKPRDTKIAILPSTTRKGTTLSTSAALDSPSVISKLVSPPQASNAGTSAESENSSHNCDDASAVLDNDGSLGSFLDATIARSRQIENTETPNENAATPVNSPESVEYSSDDLDEDYVELDDDFIEKCNATTDARKIKKLLAEHAVRYKLSPDPKFATSPININDKDYDFSLDLSHIAIVEKTPFCGTEKESVVEHMIEKRTPDDAEELLAKIGQNHDDWSTPEPTPTPIVKKRGMIKLNDEDMREAKKSLKEKGIKPEDVKNLPPIEDLCEITPPSSMIEDFEFHRSQTNPMVRYKIYNKTINLPFSDFCAAIRVPRWGSCEKVRGTPRELSNLYTMICNGRSFSNDGGKISSIQQPAIRYFAYFVTKCVLARRNAKVGPKRSAKIPDIHDASPPLSSSARRLILPRFRTPPPPPCFGAAPPPPPAAMANFELDPHRFLPRGHGIIDGGVLRLPRTFVTPTQFTPDQFESFCVAVVEPEPPSRIRMICYISYGASSSIWVLR
ncbi:hypothetical protein QYE76_012043 [Lolium multiflorum]|uniref:Bromo domain-containing protein n=1 Tax=Lolium multiflorum TaxID=4521 RepID=A0AAD8TWH7_LOLMU|nr:hypothetical protein QYE76_012043 [Lolium multiflorum]